MTEKAIDLTEGINNMENDLISRQAAIEALGKRHIGWNEWDCWQSDVEVIKDLPSAEPERLTDEDFETIRIHLNAYKGQLCNQYRWEEAEEYQRIIDRFISFASAQPEIIHCKDCKYGEQDKDGWWYCGEFGCVFGDGEKGDGFCSDAERREDAAD